MIRVDLNENAFGASPHAAAALKEELQKLSRYANKDAVYEFAGQVAAYEQVPVEHVLLEDVLGALGLYLGSQGRDGGEFVYSVPGYMALIDAASHVGGRGVPVPLNAQHENDLTAIAARVNKNTRAVYLINPHNPTGTVSDSVTFKEQIREIARFAPVIVDEAYLEYAGDFESRSAASLLREGENVLVFRTFDKIYGLAGLPIGYTLAPRALADTLRKQGFGAAEALGRLHLTAAAASLADRAHVRQVREVVERERTQWVRVLDELGLEHSDFCANFVFFNAGLSQVELRASMKARGIEIGRSFPPYERWARISIGIPEENAIVQRELSDLLRARRQ